MKLLKTKTARFAAVVDACGAPQVYTPWQSPKKDRRLQTQIRQDAIMTIQRSESGSDFGCVGFIERKGARVSRLPEILEALRGSADRGHQMGAGEEITATCA